MDLKSTPIRIHNDTIQMLNDAKVHPRETYDDVIRRLLKEGEKRSENSD